LMLYQSDADLETGWPVFGLGLKVSIPPQGGPFAKQTKRFGCLTTKLIG
jgi:hypothetical protein